MAASGASAVNSFAMPVGLFGGATGSVVNARWRAIFGERGELPAPLAEALASVRESRSVQQLELEVELDTHVGTFAVKLEPVITASAPAPAVLAVCVEITDKILATELAVDARTLIWWSSGYYNAAWRERIGGTWRDAVHDKDLARWTEALGESERERGSRELAVRLKCREGAYRWHRVRLSLLRGRLIACATDVDAEHRHESKRNELVAEAETARAEAERANRLKDEFLAAVSHELRAPLTTMLLWEKVLRESDDEASRTRALDAIHHSAVAQARLVGDLLDVARGISGKLYLDIRVVDIVGLVTEALDAPRALAVAKSIELVGKFAPSVGAVRADATRLRQVLDNLLSNAIKFTAAGGSVSVSVSRRGRTVTIEVEDTGRGISPDFLPRIFEPFSQVEDAYTRAEGGLGLGLTISKQLVDLHRGTLTASSKGLGKGAKFSLTLPAAAAPRGALARPTSSGQRARLDGARVLVIDDDARVREALAVVLARVGVHVDTADSAEVGRARIADGQPEAVICDIAMPGEDGYSFLRGLRASGSKVPSIALTAYSTQRDAQRALEAGFDVHLTKPISITLLVDALNDLLGKRRGAAT